MTRRWALLAVSAAALAGIGVVVGRSGGESHSPPPAVERSMLAHERAVEGEQTGTVRP